MTIYYTLLQLLCSHQVVALCAYPDLLEDDKFPEDAKNRARRILQACGGGSIGEITLTVGRQCVKKTLKKHSLLNIH